MMEGSLCAKQRQICVYMSRAVAAMENTNIMSTVLLKGHFTFFFIFIYLFIYLFILITNAIMKIHRSFRYSQKFHHGVRLHWGIWIQYF